jgi:hypothetical protein
MKRCYQGLWALFQGCSGVGDTLIDNPWKEGLEPEIVVGREPGSRAARTHATQARIDTGVWVAEAVRTGSSAFVRGGQGPKKGLLAET